MNPQRILVIDDEKLVTDSIQRALKKNGYQVIVAGTAKEALALVSNTSFDLIICDIRMPDMDGVDTLKEIRQILLTNKRMKIPEILITGYADPEMEKKAQMLNVTEYIYKPFDLRDFLDCIQKSLGKN